MHKCRYVRGSCLKLWDKNLRIFFPALPRSPTWPQSGFQLFVDPICSRLRRECFLSLEFPSSHSGKDNIYLRHTTFFAADILSFFTPGPWKYRVFIALFLAGKVEGLFYYFQPGPPLPCNNIWLGNVLHMAVKDNIV